MFITTQNRCQVKGLFLIFSFSVLEHILQEVIFVLFQVNNLKFFEEDQIFFEWHSLYCNYILLKMLYSRSPPQHTHSKKLLCQVIYFYPLILIKMTTSEFVIKLYSWWILFWEVEWNVKIIVELKSHILTQPRTFYGGSPGQRKNQSIILFVSMQNSC